jgi:hypothetical protein
VLDHVFRVPELAFFRQLEPGGGFVFSLFKVKKRWSLPGLLVGLLICPAFLGADAARLQAAYGSIPLIFEPNQGQTDPSVLFLSRNKGFTLFLTSQEAVVSLHGAAPRPPRDAHGRKPAGLRAAGERPRGKSLRLRWLGAAGGIKGSGIEALPGHSNYFRGNDPSRWFTDVPQFGRVLLDSVYPGISLTYYDGGQRDLELDWLVEPGADPSKIEFQLEGMAGLSLDGDGGLVADLGDGQRFQLKAPVAYQDSGHRVAVDAAYRLGKGARVSLALGGYDKAAPLVIDPVLDYSTYLGGSSDDSGQGIAVDPAGNAYITGSTDSADFPLVGSLESTTTFQDAFVTKINAAGTALVYSTYLGGGPAAWVGDVTSGYAIALDSSQDAYVAGSTSATHFPLQNAVQSTCVPCVPGFSGNAFVTELSPAGNALVFSTYLGGSSHSYNGMGEGDSAAGIAVDSSGSAVVVGSTASTDFPTLNAIQNACFGCVSSPTGTYNGFVAKFAPGGASLDYSTYLGLGPQTEALCVAVDGAGNAYVGGTGPVPLSHPLATAGEAFVAKLDAAGDTLVYSTQLGAWFVSGIAVDAAGAAFLTGEANAGLPLVHPIETTPTFWAAFISKLNPAGSALLYSTYFGGAWTKGFGSKGAGIAVDSSGDAYVVGRTSSPSLPLANAWQSTCPSCTYCPTCNYNWQGDAFVTELDPNGSTLVYSSYLGGKGYIYTYSDGTRSITGDVGSAIALDTAGNAYVTGGTNSIDFPTQAPLQAVIGGTSDAFVAKISALRPSATATVTLTLTRTPSLTASPTFTASPTVTPTLTASPSFTASPTASPSSTVTPTFTVTPTPGLPGDSFRIIGVFPNPFGSTGTNIGVEVGYRSELTMRIYTVRGEQVYHVTWHNVGPSKSQLPWNGKTDAGVELANGAYYMTLEAVGQGQDHQAGQWISAWH